MNMLRPIVLIPSLLVLAGCSVQVHDPPYPESGAIEDVHWDLETHRTAAVGSDNWPTTWADDGHQYTSWGDGGGFGGTNTKGRVSLGFARIEGGWDDYEGYNVWGGEGAENPAQFDGKCYGLLSIDGVLYAWIMLATNNYDAAQIAWSTNHAASFERGFVIDERDDAFAAPTFLNFGQDYADARDDYVYVYSGRPLDDCDDRCIGEDVDLARVPRGRIRDRQAYEFFSGLHGGATPTWSFDIAQKQPVFSDPNGAGTRLGVVFHPGVGRYLMTIAHNNSGGLGIFDAPEPWGPWTTVAYYDDWLGFGYSPSYHIASQKWMEADGNSAAFTMVWSSKDRWNTIRGSFNARTRSADGPGNGRPTAMPAR